MVRFFGERFADLSIVMKTTFETAELSTMVEDLRTELSTFGGTYRLYVAWGRKPEGAE